MTDNHQSPATRTVEVELGQRSYGIDIGADLLPRVGRIVRQVAPANKAAVISDQTVADLHSRPVIESLRQAGYETHLLTFPPGDESKNLRQAERLCDGLAAARIERSNPIVALGGGVTGDLAGLVAAMWLRGVPFVQVPTTLEADVDASVGGKVAVNHSSGKNMIGAFYQPRRVIIDVAALHTLGRRDVAAGLAESVKHGLIRDAAFFAWHEAHAEAVLARRDDVTAELVERNVRIKAAVVAADEREAGLRAILNFGHTFGHAIEAEMQYTWRHGECVSVGMVAACRIGLARGTLGADAVARIEGLLGRLGLPVRVERHIDTAALIERMRHDKKVKGGRIQFVLPVGIGQVQIVDDVTDAELREAAAAIGAGFG